MIFTRSRLAIALTFAGMVSIAPVQANVIITTADIVHELVTSVTVSDLINWKVGDSADYNVSAGSFGTLGTMTKAVTKDEGTTLWLKEDMNLSIQQQKVEVQINKADGKILKLIVNGQEQAVPDDKIEIISQDYAEVTVPAGKFKAIHVIAKSKESSKIEVWANPRDTIMEGTIKQIMATQMGFDLTIELTKFNHGT